MYHLKLQQLFLFAVVLCVSICGISGYSVDGNKIYDPTGAKTIIRGVCRPSFEWNAVGEHASYSDYALMRNKWGANVVRISLNQDFWFAGPSYAATIDQQIAWIRQLNMGVILDLHWNQGKQQNMADRNSIKFWSQVAAHYKGNPWIMFELYNEPHDVSWDQWLNGDSQYAGMQNMYDAVRAAGADNVVIVGGLDWAYDLSGVGKGFAVKGSNIAYATHPYDFPGKQVANWAAGFGFLAQTAPIIMTEFGQYCATNTYVADLLNYAEALGIHWTAWAWYVQGCAFPSVISDWEGTPYPGIGETVKRYMTTGTSLPTSGPSINAVATPSVSPTSAPPATGSLSVYASGLQNGWEDWSWSTSYSLSDTQYLRAGPKSIRFEAMKNQGVYFHATQMFAINSYNSLVFYVNGGSSDKPGNTVSVKIYSSSGNVIGSSVDLPVTIAANKWTQVVIPISAFGLSPSTMSTGFVLQSNAVASVGNIWFDNVVFMPAVSVSTQAPTQAATQAPTKAPTTAPPQSATARPATQAPTQPATQAPTQPATQAPTQPATQAPTKSATQAPATVAPTKAATAAPATQAPATVAPTKAATQAPTKAATQAPTKAATQAPSTGNGCGAANVRIVQTKENSWEALGATVAQYKVEVQSTCAGKTLTGVTFSASNWNTLSAWNIVASASDLSIPPYTLITPASSFSFGYQSAVGQASFTITSVTFQ